MNSILPTTQNLTMLQTTSTETLASKYKKNIPLINPTLGKFILSSQEKRQGVLMRIRTSDLSIQMPTLYHLSYPDETNNNIHSVFASTVEH
jgi:hypothetical protein